MFIGPWRAGLLVLLELLPAPLETISPVDYQGHSEDDGQERAGRAHEHA